MRTDIMALYSRAGSHFVLKEGQNGKKTKERAKSLVGLDREGNQESSG